MKKGSLFRAYIFEHRRIAQWARKSLYRVTVYYMYAGPPSPPEPQLHVFSATAIELSWLPPFSWVDYPIVNYTVKVHSIATGEVTNSTVYAKSTEMLSSTVTFIHTSPHGGVVQDCEQLVFSVSAANNIGWSSQAVVTGGFPIGKTNLAHTCTLRRTVCSRLTKLTSVKAYVSTARGFITNATFISAYMQPQDWILLLLRPQWLFSLTALYCCY